MFIIFAAIAAFINYQALILQYGAFFPASVLQISTVSSMLTYILLAVLSFVVAAICSHATRETAEKERPLITQSVPTEITT